MNATRTLTIALALGAVLAAPALAQRPGGQDRGGPGGRFGQGGGFGMMGSSLSGLLMAEPVRQELELTDEQVEQLRPIGEQLRSDMMGRMQELRDQLADLSPEQRRERFEQLSGELNAKAREQLAGVLKPEQMQRLEQINLQQQGIQALGSPEVAGKLGLNDEQKSKIDGILASYRDQTRAIMENARDAQNRGEAFARLNELRDSSMEEAKAVLTDEQRATWDELTGEPFEMPRGAFGRGGGPGGPGGRRPAGN